MGIPSIPEIVRSARQTKSQAEFAKILGVKQASVSRYESGKTSPPRKVLERCMQLMHNETMPPSADELANKIKAILSGNKYSHVRLALASIIDSLGISH